MTGYTFPFFHQRFFDNSGKPLSGGKIYFYAAGSVIPKDIYLDKGLTTPAQNPLTLDSAGICPQYFVLPGEYDIKITNQYGVIIDTPRRIETVSTSGTGSPISISGTGWVYYNSSTSAFSTSASTLPPAYNSGFLYYDISTSAYSWTSVPADTYKVKSTIDDASPDYLFNKVKEGPGIILGTSQTGNDIDVTISSNGTLRTSNTDLSPQYLSDKLIDSSSVKWNIINPGATESISADVDLTGVTDAFKVKTDGTDAPGFLVDKFVDSESIHVSATLSGTMTFSCWGAPPTGLAGGDLTDYYPDPLVKELSGLGASWGSVNSQWVTGGNFTPFSGVFSLSLKVAGGLGVLINNYGRLYVTKDGGLTWTDAGYSISNYGNTRDIEFGKINATNNGWAAIGDNAVYFFEDISANYDGNGLPLQSAWQIATFSITGADIAYSTYHQKWLFAQQVPGMSYCQYLTSGSLIVSSVTPYGATGNVGGIFVESNTANIVYFERGTGRVWYAGSSFSNKYNWTEVLHNSTPILKSLYPEMTDSDGVGTGVSMGGLSVFAGNVIISTTDVTDESKYMMSFDKGTLPSLWNITTDGVNWFGTTVNSTPPCIYQLWLGSIPAHRQLIAEKGIVVEGKAILQDIPNAEFLGTDAWGNVIAKSAPNPNPNGNGYVCTMHVANATTVLAPNLIGLRNELTVLFVPFADMKVTYNVSKFGCFLSQTGTGTLNFTLRDEQYRLIAASSTITNPSPSVFLELVAALVQDPITQTGLTSYTLKMGERYNLGISWTANGIQLLGDETNQNTNITPYPAYKVDNITGGLIYQLTGGGEAKQRPFIRLVTK